MKKQLDNWYNKICVSDFIKDDPVQFPHRYKKREDIEIASFLAAAIAWGNRKMILNSCEKMFALIESKGKSPYDYIMSGNYKNLKNKNIHRTFFESDLKYICAGFKHCYEKYGKLENIFIHRGHGDAEKTEKIWDGIRLFRDEMAAGNRGIYSKHISNPEKSACKRINMALRWLVRKKPVDLGLWKNIKPGELYIPLDVHVARTARKLGLLKRKTDDKKAVIELTERLRSFCPEDPVKYDFALFGIGVNS